MIKLDANVMNFIANHSSFTTAEFSEMLRREAPGIGRSTIYQILKNLCDENIVSRTSRGHFQNKQYTVKRDYSYELSDTAKSISSMITAAYPLVEYQIWELFQMNEFVNHLMAKNTVFVEVESPLDESVFQILFEKQPHVLHNPNVEEYYKYAGEETIIVRKLISEAPPASGTFRQASLEKILVDLFGHGLSGAIISRSEYRAIYEDSFQKYNINLAKLFRYARRRGNEQTIRDYIRDNTNITLETDR